MLMIETSATKLEWRKLGIVISFQPPCRRGSVVQMSRPLSCFLCVQEALAAGLFYRLSCDW
jgi:hypothetical protein